MKTSASVDSARVLSDWRLLLAFGFGSGLAPRAPGTFGTLVAVPIAWLLHLLPLPAYWVVVVVFFALGVWLCDYAARQLGVHDHSGIVWDEVVGYLIACAFVEVSWLGFLFAFVLFRFFDIVKPWPISLADRSVGGGFGIMLDDVLAGLAAAAVLKLGYVLAAP